MKKKNKITIRLNEQQLKMLIKHTIDNQQTKSSFLRQILDEKMDEIVVNKNSSQTE